MLLFRYRFATHNAESLHRPNAPLRSTHNAGSLLLFYAPFRFALYTKAIRRTAITLCYVLHAHNIEFHLFCYRHQYVIFIQSVYNTDHVLDINVLIFLISNYYK